MDTTVNRITQADKIMLRAVSTPPNPKICKTVLSPAYNMLVLSLIILSSNVDSPAYVPNPSPAPANARLTNALVSHVPTV